MRRLVTAIAVGLLACSAVAAQNVTLKVDDAPLVQVVADLARQTGADIDVGMAEALPQPPRVSFDVKDMPLRAVLRLIGEQTGGHFESWEEGSYYYVDEPDPLAEAPMVRAGPYYVRIGSIRIEDARELRFRTDFPEPLEVTHYMLVQLSVDADDDLDLARFSHVDPKVTGVDNTGQRISTAEPQPEAVGEAEDVGLEGFDLEGWWSMGEMEPTLSLSQPAPTAVSLATLEGKLVAYRQARRITLRVPLPPPTTPIAKETVSLVVTGAVPSDEGYEVQGTLTPVGDGWGPTDPDVRTRLELADGTLVRGYETESGVEWGENDRPTRGDYTWQFENLPAARPVALICEVISVSPDTETIPFRFDNIPLPTWGE
jgi:hypothetical protein